MNSEIGFRIRQARKGAGFESARAYAKHAEIAAATFQSWEAGERTPKLDDFRTMAADFKVNAAWLCGFSSSREIPVYLETGEQLLPIDSEMSPTIDPQDTVRVLPFGGPVTRPGLYSFGNLIRRVAVGTDGGLWVKVDNPRSHNEPVPLNGMTVEVTGIVAAIIKQCPLP